MRLVTTPSAGPPLPSGANELRLDISTFRNAWDKQPVPRSTTLSGLIRALASFPVIDTANKLELPAWSPARFAAGATRRAESVEALSCLVLDFDAGDPEQALESWRGTLVIAHSTWSHTTDSPRFRLVVPLARPVPKDRWAAVWAWAAERSRGCDAACKDPSRLYFRPAIRRGDSPHFGHTQHGQVLDALALVPRESGHVGAPRAPKVRVPARLRNRAIEARFANHPDTRERVAADIGAVLTGEGTRQRAVNIPCPGCGRPSVWYFVAPLRMGRARCNHRNSCGWSGGIDSLVSLRAS